jgi:hypothetical protein
MSMICANATRLQVVDVERPEYLREAQPYFTDFLARRAAKNHHPTEEEMQQVARHLRSYIRGASVVAGASA